MRARVDVLLRGVERDVVESLERQEARCDHEDEVPPGRSDEPPGEPRARRARSRRRAARRARVTPAARSTDAARMPTNADAHRTTVTRAAPREGAAGMRAARDIDDLGRAAGSGDGIGHPSCKPAPAPDRCAPARRASGACASPTVPSRAMPKLTPKIILEGTRLTHKTDLAFALNEHPRIVGPRKYRYHSPLISAEWCGFTPYAVGPRADQLRARRRGGGARARGVRRLGPADRAPAALLVDHRPVPPLGPVVPAPAPRAGRGLHGLEARLRALDVHLVLCTRAEGTWEAARAERLLVSGNPSQYDDLDAFRREQDLLRRLASASALPVLELDLSDGDVDAACDRVADWMASTGGLWPREAEVAGEPGRLARGGRRRAIEQHRDRAVERVARRPLQPRLVRRRCRPTPRPRPGVGGRRAAAAGGDGVGEACREVGHDVGERRRPRGPPGSLVARRGRAPRVR